MKRYRVGLMALVMVFSCGMTYAADPVVEKGTNETSQISQATALAAAAGNLNLVGNLSKIQANEISGWGAQVGVMLKGFVESVGDGVKMTTEEICRVADTRVGKICTFVIVYKLVGKDLIVTGRELLRTFCGIILLIIYCTLVFRFYRAFFFKTAVLEKVEGKVKTYIPVKSLAEKLDDDNIGEGVSWLVAMISVAIFLGIGALICQMI